MINESKTAKSMLNILNNFVTAYNLETHIETANNIVLVPDGDSYDPPIDQTYLLERLVSNDDHQIGIGFADSDIQYSFYEIKIFSPKKEFKWPNLDLAALIKKEFHKKRIEINEGLQTIQVSTVDQSPFMTLKAFHCTVLSVNLSVIATNK